MDLISRPRCRDWTPLITQQLRLRNLIQISGHNIACAPKSTVYYTLHPTPMSAPCFTSAASTTPSNAIWPEINCVDFITSTALSICVRVWQRQTDSKQTTVDSQLFLWVVYFSGLIPISRRTDVRLIDNALVFHLHGGFFTSAACLKSVSVLEQLVYIVGHKQRSQSVVDAAAAAAAAQAQQDEEDEALDAEAYPTSNNVNTMPPPLPPDSNGLKLRFIERRFYGNEIRASYSVEKLQLLQRKQRQLQKQTTRTQALREQICSRSAYCMSDRPADAIVPATNAHGVSSLRHQQHQRPNNSVTSSASSPLTLQRLLNQQPQLPRPEVLWRAQQVRRQLETARFRAELLRQARIEANERAAQLQRRVAKLHDANVERESWLLTSYRDIHCEKERAEELRVVVRRQEEQIRCVRDAVKRRRLQLLGELQEVFAVEAKGVQQSCTAEHHITTCTLYAINGAALPNSEAFTEQTMPSEMSVALGWAAHLTVMCAVVLDVPLRNEVLLYGSSSRIRDDVKEMQHSERELPLYCRSCPPPLPVRNACFLLNQNIGQLLVGFGYTTIDCRATLYNLLKLMQSPTAQQRRRNNASECRPSATSVTDASDCIDGLMDDLRITDDNVDVIEFGVDHDSSAECDQSDAGMLVTNRKRQQVVVSGSSENV